MRVPAFAFRRDIPIALFLLISFTHVNAAVAHDTTWQAVQAEYEEVVVACRKLPPDRDRDCLEQAKKKYGELLRSKS